MQLSAPRGAPVIHRTAWEWNRGVGRTKSPVWLWNSVFLVFVWRIKNICCLFSFSRGVYGALVVLTFLKRSPAKEVGEAGEKTPIFPAGKVAIWIAQQDKFMAALRWFLPRENSRIINRKVKFEIFAIP